MKETIDMLRSVLRWPLLIAAMLALAPSAAFAQADYPNHAIKIIVPVPPGNMLDAMPRIVGDKLSPRWNQPVVVENRPGAASNLGSEAVFKSPPDGYTLLVTPPGPLSVSQHVYTRLAFDPTQFVPVSVLVRFPFLLIANPKVPVANLQELIARAKANPDKVTFATPGVSSTPHLTMEKLSRAAGIRFVHVPYQGMTPALNDLLGGHVDVMFDTPGNVMGHVRDGKVKLLAVTGTRRLADFPAIPSLADINPDVVHEDWFAVVAPPKTPSQIADKLSQAIAETLKLPDVAKRISDAGFTAVGATPAETAALIKSESEKFRQVIAAAGIKIEQ
jgi:tripartite-type tricarboxylate transporter receptor subunit TctC